VDRKYELQYLPEGDLQLWTVKETFTEKDEAIRAAENLLFSGMNRVQVVYSEIVYTTER
jgi:hypothetical protein